MTAAHRQRVAGGPSNIALCFGAGLRREWLLFLFSEVQTLLVRL